MRFQLILLVRLTFMLTNFCVLACIDNKDAITAFIGMDMNSGGYPFRTDILGNALIANEEYLLKWISSLEKYVIREGEHVKLFHLSLR